MKYNHFRFHEDVSRKIGNSSFFVGLGVAIDQHFSINDDRLDTIPGSPEFYITNHYSYSLKNDFNPVKYGGNGIKFTLLTDTRDHIGNCYNGYYVSASMIYNFKIGNNSQQSTRLLYEAMYYLGLSRKNPRHVLAFWSWGSFIMQGNVPYLDLPAIGWDTYNRSGRGFIQGRFRGLNMMYNETEYRFPVTKNGLFGGALFVNATNVSSYDQKLFEKVAIGFGGGLRIQFDNRSRTNLGIDFGIGSDRSRGIYFNLQETF
jgi:outer membrane protein assembly factor BamA